MKLTWLGHSCFKMESNGYTIILDPYEGWLCAWTCAGAGDGRCGILQPWLHSDHNGRETVTLKQDGVLSPFTITEIHTWHDDARAQSVAVTASVFLMTEPTMWHIWEILAVNWSRNRSKH